MFDFTIGRMGFFIPQKIGKILQRLGNSQGIFQQTENKNTHKGAFEITGA
jgi:hypothetical protein